MTYISTKTPSVLPPKESRYYRPFDQHDEDWLRAAMAPVAAKENAALLKTDNMGKNYALSGAALTARQISGMKGSAASALAKRRKMLEDPNSNHNRILRYLARVKSAGTAQVSAMLGLSPDGARYSLNRMHREGYIVQIGDKRPGVPGGGVRWGLPK